MATTHTTAARAAAALDALLAPLNSGDPGSLRIYAGTVPADADAALGGATLLAQLALSVPAFSAAANTGGVVRATADPITTDASADASGTATFFRLLSGAGVVVHQGDVTNQAGDGALKLVNTSIVAGQPVAVSALTVDLPKTRTV